MGTRQFLSLFPLLALACAGGGDKDRRERGGDADADADADSDTDADTDSDTDADSDCGEWTGFAAGASWIWDYDAEGSTGSYAMEITSLSGGEVEAELSYALSGTGYTYDAVGTSAYTCASDGLYIEEVYLEYETVAGGYTYEGWSRTTYAGGQFVQPRSLEVGDTWEVDAEATVESSTSAPADYTYSYAYEVEAEEEVEVEAGTFDALRILEASYGARTWVARDVGTVKSDFSELVSYAR